MLVAGLIPGLVAAAFVAPHVALLFVPALALGLALSLGRFPGERAINRLRTRAGSRRRRTPTPSAVRPRPLLRAKRAGVTLAFSLAVNPPPLPQH